MSAIPLPLAYRWAPPALLTLVAVALFARTTAAQSSDDLGKPAPGPGTPYVQVVGGDQNLLAPLFDNGPWITGIGNGAGGADTSEIESGWSNFGYNINQSASPFRIADDFTVPAGDTWTLSGLTWRAYQTGSTTSGSITSAAIRIWDGPPDGGGTVIAGDTTTNRFTGQLWSGVYRVTSTTLTNTQRPVIDLAIDMSWAPSLGPGTYWLDVGLTGSLASGPWANPTVPWDSTDNGRQLDGTSWAPIMDGPLGLAQDMPFLLEGNNVPTAPTHDRQLANAWLTQGPSGLDLNIQTGGSTFDGAPSSLDLSIGIRASVNGVLLLEDPTYEFNFYNPDGAFGCACYTPCGTVTSNLFVFPKHCYAYYPPPDPPNVLCVCSFWRMSSMPLGGSPITQGDLVTVEIFPSPGSLPEGIAGNDVLQFTFIGLNYCDSNPNSTGLGAIMGAQGSASIALDDLTLTASRVPHGQPGVFFYGAQQAQIPFGNGYRCVAGQPIRLPVAVSQDGTLARQVDFGSLPSGGTITPGSTWNFQCWYRDPDGGGSGTNLSDGFAITFTP